MNPRTDPVYNLVKPWEAVKFDITHLIRFSMKGRLEFLQSFEKKINFQPKGFHEGGIIGTRQRNVLDESPEKPKIPPFGMNENKYPNGTTLP